MLWSIYYLSEIQHIRPHKTQISPLETTASTPNTTWNKSPIVSITSYSGEFIIHPLIHTTSTLEHRPKPITHTLSLYTLSLHNTNGTISLRRKAMTVLTTCICPGLYMHQNNIVEKRGKETAQPPVPQHIPKHFPHPRHVARNP